MGLLNKATSGRQASHRRVLLYGTHGIGKSSWAAAAPSPIVLDVEGGTADIDYAARLDESTGLTSLEAVEDAIRELIEEDHAFKTIVIDSVDWLEQWIWDHVCQQMRVDSIEKIPYGKGYQLAVTHWRSLLQGLDLLRSARGMTIVLIAHSKIQKYDSPESESYDRYEPKFHKHASAVLMDWCDEVLFAGYKTFVRTQSEGAKERAIGVGRGERVVRTTERPSHLAKNRLSLPDELPLDWSAYADYIG